MTIGTRVDSTSGPVPSNGAQGLSVARDTSNRGFQPYLVDSVKAFVSSSAQGNSPVVGFGDAGVCTLSGSGATLTAVMPTAASCPGAEFTFRCLDARAHALTGSAETAGTQVFSMVGVSGSTAQSLVGSKITFPATIGAAVTVKSDGVNFQVIGARGVLTINGT